MSSGNIPFIYFSLVFSHHLELDTTAEGQKKRDFARSICKSIEFKQKLDILNPLEILINCVSVAILLINYILVRVSTP